MNILIKVITVICLIIFIKNVQAESQLPIGYIKTLTGDATITTGSKIIIAKVGTPIYQSSKINTGSKSTMGITLKDATVISFGPETEFIIDRYTYEPAENNLEFYARMTRGSLHYISGIIARLLPEAVKIKTPTGIIGVRGTRFLAKV